MEGHGSPRDSPDPRSSSRGAIDSDAAVAIEKLDADALHLLLARKSKGDGRSLLSEVAAPGVRRGSEGDTGAPKNVISPPMSMRRSSDGSNLGV